MEQTTPKLPDNAPDRSPLMVAAALGDLRRARACIAQGIPVDGQRHNGETALLIACAAGHAHIVLELLSHGADVELAQADGSTALHIACASKHGEIAQLLLIRGADPNARKSDAQTPLLTALFHGDTTLVQNLLRRGAELNVRRNDGYSSLMAAAQGGLEQSVDALLAADAPVDQADEDGWTALLYCVEPPVSHHSESIARKLLAAGADAGHCSTDGDNAARLAAMAGLDRLAADLIDCSDGISNTVDLYSDLIAAIDGGSVDTVRVILNRGAPLAGIDSDSWSPLMHAIQRERPSIVTELLGRGADATKTTADGWSPILLAAEIGDVDVFEALLSAGAKLCSRLPNGDDALQLAAKHNHAAIAAITVANGAMIDTTTAASPLLLALETQRNDLFDAVAIGIRQLRGIASDLAVIYAAEWPTNHALEALVAGGVSLNVFLNDPDDSRHDGWTPLLAAFAAGSTRTTAYLIAAGASLEHRRADGYTCLMAAACGGNAALLAQPLEICDVDAVDGQGMTALMYAAALGHDECVRNLLKAGANRLAVNAAGEDAATLARTASHDSTVSLF